MNNSKQTTIFVSGGSGRIGSHVVRKLVETGFKVLSFDRTLPRENVTDAEYIVGDINDLNLLREKMKGIDIVIHLAALPDPGRGEPYEIMQINVIGTFKVFQAAVDNGVKKVIQASSINALGAGYGISRFNVKYFPIDEEHPSCISDPYSLSKKIDEEIGEYFWQRHNLSNISFRFPGVSFHEHIQPMTEKRRERFSRVLSALENVNVNERENYFNSLFTDSNLKRFSWKTLHNDWNKLSEEEKDEYAKGFISKRILRDFCSYIHIFDCVEFVVSAVNSNFSGAIPLFINSSDNGKICETSRIIKIFFPYVKDIRREFKAYEPLINGTKAENLLGYKAKHSIECI